MSRQMKDSGIEWIGEIPDDWTLGRIGQLYSERREKVSDTEYAPLSVTMQGIVPQLSTAAKTDAHDDRKLVKKGDFAINSRSDRRGSCGVSPFDGSVSLINTILCPHDDMNAGYYNWLFHTTMFADEYYKWGHGIVNDLWTTGWQDMKRISIPVPCIEEQEKIAKYLDQQCAYIDAIIEKTKASIEEYKKLKQAVITEAVTKGVRGERSMKDSGIEWIGEIPSDWDICSFKRVIKKKIDNRGRTPELLDDNSGIPLLEVGAIGSKYPKPELIKKYIAQKSHDEYIRDDVATGDLIVTTVGATIGKCSIVPDEFNYCIAQNLVAYRVNDENNPLYWFYYFKSSSFQHMFAQYDKGNTINNVKISDMEQGYVIVAPLEEQIEISNYLDDKCKDMDVLIEKKEQILSELEVYKKSLIYEYVTGKKEVPQSCQ